MEELITKEKEFQELVHIIRGQQVMLDSDLAQLYGTEVKNLNRQVKRNIEKFPEDFMFQLIEREAQDLWCQNGTAINSMSRTMPYAFTEQGIYMVATILKNDIATQQSIYIMRSFKEMKHYIAENKQLISSEEIQKLSNHMIDQDKRITDIESKMATKTDIDKIMDNFINEDNIKEKLFLNGEVFDAAEAYIKIYKQAKHSIYIIDDYINIDTLGLLKKKQKNVDVTLFTRNCSDDKLNKLEVEKFNKQYPKLLLKFASKNHDRFIVIDYGTKNEKAYLCGASSKDAGKKICTIIQMQDKDTIHPVIDDLLESNDFLFR